MIMVEIILMVTGETLCVYEADYNKLINITFEFVHQKECHIFVLFTLHKENRVNN